jgi:glycosyltransferase involved in cell wall biosynthesis
VAMKFSIVIPCYNEEKNIPLILERFNQIINRNDIEVILVNNGSMDNSEEILKELIGKYKFAKTIKVEKNQGYGFGILSGLKETQGEYIGWTHADMQTDPRDLLKALHIIEQKQNPQNIFIKGNRKGRAFFDIFFTIGMSFFESLYMKKKLWDINAQPTVFHRSFYEKWNNPPYDFSLDLYALYMAKLHKLDIIRFKVLFPKRIHGESSWNTSFKAKWKFIKRTLSYSLKLKKELKK